MDAVDFLSLGIIDPWESHLIQSELIKRKQYSILNSGLNEKGRHKSGVSNSKVNEWLSKNSKYLNRENLASKSMSSDPLLRKKGRERREVGRESGLGRELKVEKERESKGSEPLKRKKKGEREGERGEEGEKEKEEKKERKDKREKERGERGREREKHRGKEEKEKGREEGKKKERRDKKRKAPD